MTRAVDSYPCSAARFAGTKHCQVAAVVDTWGQRGNARNKFVPIHCQDKAIFTREETHAAHDLLLLRERALPARTLVMQAIAEKFGSCITLVFVSPVFDAKTSSRCSNNIVEPRQ